jgi:hypothetical protein
MYFKENTQMNVKKLFSLVIIILVTLSFVSNTMVLSASTGETNQDPNKLPHPFDFDGPAYPEPNFVFEGQLPELPTELMVYSVVGPNITEAIVRDFANKYFGIANDAKLTRSRRLGRYNLEAANEWFMMDPATGGFEFEKIKQHSSQKVTKKDFPSKAQCQGIAKAFLASHSLFPPDAYLKERVADRSSSGVMGVRFGRKINGYAASGAGARLWVDINPDGEVVKVRKKWKTLRPYKRYPIKSPQEALEELLDGKGQLMNGCNGKIENITIRYYCSPQKQAFVQPIYFFECVGPKRRFTGYVPAIKREYLKSKEETMKEIKEKARTRSK